MFHNTRNEMKHWRWDNPSAFGYRVDRCNPWTTTSEKVKFTGEGFSWYNSDYLSAKFEPGSCRLYKPGDILAVGPLICAGIIDNDDHDANWADPGVLSGGWTRPVDGNDNDNGQCVEDMQGGENGKGKGKETKDGKGKGKWKGKGNGKGKGSVKQTPGGDDLSLAVALQWQKEWYEVDSDSTG